MLPDYVYVNIGYKKIILDNNKIAAYFNGRPDKCNVIIEVDYRETEFIAKADIDVVAYGIVNFLYEQGFSNVNILFIIDTYSQYIAAELMGNNSNYWVLDTYDNKLVIPQNDIQIFKNEYDIINNYIIGGTCTQKYKKRHVHMINYLIIIINILVYFWLEFNGSTLDAVYMLEHGGLYWPYMEQYGQWYRLVSSMFMHFGFAHLFNNMIVLFFIGDNLERALGKIKYLLLYLISGIFSNMISCIYYEVTGVSVVGCGASGAIFGVVGALLYIIIVNKGKYEDLTIRRMILFIVLSIYSGVTSPGINMTAHISGLIAGFISAVFLYKKYNGGR